MQREARSGGEGGGRETRISSRRAQLAASGVGEKRKRQRAARDERVNGREKERENEGDRG